LNRTWGVIENVRIQAQEIVKIVPADRQVTLEFQRRLEEITMVLDVRLFGSRARGDAVPDSDLDVFVEVDSLTPELRRRIDEIAWEIGFERDYIISPVVVTHDELQQGPLGASPLILTIEREGVSL
jgi:tRNA nucleotidyltransferase (CCA-adding enzyme)